MKPTSGLGCRYLIRRHSRAFLCTQKLFQRFDSAGGYFKNALKEHGAVVLYDDGHAAVHHCIEHSRRPAVSRKGEAEGAVRQVLVVGLQGEM